MLAASFPRQDVPLIQKTPEWMSKHLNYAETLLRAGSDSRARMDALFQSYNGDKSASSLKWLENRYGKKNVASFQTYRVGRTKLNLLHGEWLKRPLAANVTTINSSAMSDKMRQQDMQLGAVLAKSALKDVKEKAGVDVMEGMAIPDTIDQVFEKMSPKDKHEDIMQIILNEQIPELDIKKKIADAFLKVLISSMCYCKVEIDEEGEVQFHEIDPRDAIFEEITGDDYLEKSPIKGCRQRLTVQQILLRYTLSEADRNKLDAARNNPDEFIRNSKGYARMIGEQLQCDVIHIEWLSLDPVYQKKSPKTKAQMELNWLTPDATDYVTLDMDAKSYEENFDMHQAKVKKGEYEILTKYRQCRYEATRIGGCIDVNMRKKNFQAINVDKPSYVLDSTYHGYICNTVDGVRISLQQMIEKLDTMYDVSMYQQNKDLARAKGKAIFYDRAGLPEGKSMAQVMWQLNNDGHVDWNSAADGNFAGKTLNPADAIKEIDLGLSASFQYLNDFKQSIINDMNQLTGINNDREGQIAASSTAMNANSAIQASRTITEPLFAGMNGFVERVLQSVVDVSAISWAFYKIEKGEQILGTQKFRYLQFSKESGYQNYGVHIEDGSKHQEMKQYAKEMLAISLNAKELRPMDAYKVMMSETMAQMNTSLTNSWMDMQKAVEKSEEANRQMQLQMSQMKEQNAYQMSKETLEDTQKHEADITVLKGDVQIKVDDNKAKHKNAETQNKIVTENIFKDTQ